MKEPMQKKNKMKLQKKKIIAPTKEEDNLQNKMKLQKNEKRNEEHTTEMSEI